MASHRYCHEARQHPVILLGRKEQVAEWVLARIKGSERSLFNGQWYEAIGFLSGGPDLIGGVVYQNWRGTDIEILGAGRPGWLTRTHLLAIFTYPFIQLGCNRVTAIVDKRNKHARQFVERLGFKYEGCCREAMPGGANAIIYGMLKTECRWIDNGQKIGTEAA